MQFQDIAAVPVVREIGGNSYTFHELTMTELAEFEQWVYDDTINSALRSLGENATEGERARVSADVAMHRTTIADVSIGIESLRGIQRLLWVSLRSSYPEITPEQAGRLVNFRNLQEMKGLVSSLIGLDTEEKTSNPPGRKPSARGAR